MITLLTTGLVPSSSGHGSFIAGLQSVSSHAGQHPVRVEGLRASQMLMQCGAKRCTLIGVKAQSTGDMAAKSTAQQRPPSPALFNAAGGHVAGPL